MTDLSSFMGMGGYAAFVWPSYIVAALVLAAVVVLSVAKARRTEAELDLIQQTRRASRPRPQNVGTPETETP